MLDTEIAAPPMVVIRSCEGKVKELNDGTLDLWVPLHLEWSKLEEVGGITTPPPFSKRVGMDSLAGDVSFVEEGTCPGMCQN